MRNAKQQAVLGKGHKMIEDAHIAIVGLGALGSVAAELLARSGVKHLAIFDRDIVEESNLQRQVYDEGEIGKEKALATAARLKKINSKIKIAPKVTDINYKNVSLLKGYDIILDCTDNLYTRFLINEFCKKNRIPWVYAGVIRNHGMVMGITSKPCFRCIIKETDHLDTCDIEGVLNTASFTIASLQVSEAFNILLKKFSPRLLHYNDGEITKIKVSPAKECPVCKGKYEYMAGKREETILSYQCSNVYIFFRKIDFNRLKKRLKGKAGKGYLFYRNLTIFETGRIIVRASSVERAKSLIAKYIGS